MAQQLGDNEDENDKFRALDSSVFKLIWRLFGQMRGYRRYLLLGNLLCIGFVFCELHIIDAIKDIASRTDRDQLPLSTLLLPVLGAAVFSRLCAWAQFSCSFYAANRVMLRMRSSFMRKLMSLPKRFFDNHPSGWLIARGTSDMNTINDFLSFSLMVLFMILSYSLVIAWKILDASPWLMLIAFGLTIFAGFFFKFMQGIIRGRVEAVSAQNSKMIAYLAEHIRGVRVIKAFAREQRAWNTYNDFNEENARLSLQVVRTSGLLLPSMDFLAMLAMAAIMSTGAWLIHAENTSLQAPELLACLLYMNMMLIPVRMSIDIYNMSLSAATSARRIFEVMDIESEIKVDENPTPLPKKINGDIHFNNVDFGYLPEQTVLHDFNLHIPSGKSVAIVGRTGSGKSTLASLIARFYDPRSGAISLDGIDLRRLDPKELHRCMAFVPQDVFLFSGSVADNIRFRCPELSQAQIEKLCRDLGTHTVIAALPQGYLTRISEGGSNLSAGQRQIIALSRALAANPDILVLDEATASLDVHTESLIEHTIKLLIQNRTTLIIAHRLSTVRNADTIIALDQGRILEQGSHDELLANGGYYSRLVHSSDLSCADKNK